LIRRSRKRREEANRLKEEVDSEVEEAVLEVDTITKRVKRMMNTISPSFTVEIRVAKRVTVNTTMRGNLTSLTSTSQPTPRSLFQRRTCLPSPSSR
jgi:hypothetical protein